MSTPDPPSDLRIRRERPADFGPIDDLITAAFGRPDEARLVRALRQDFPERHAGFVAALPEEAGGPGAEGIVGHVFYSSVSVDGSAELGGMGLAPMAVLPAFQRQGIGSVLLRRSLEGMRDGGARWVVLVGHPDFYRRAGFRPGVEFGLRCEFPVPDEVFLVRELVPGALEPVRGTVRYAPRFHELE